VILGKLILLIFKKRKKGRKNIAKRKRGVNDKNKKLNTPILDCRQK
jgi:hypothetical protein